MNMESTQAVAVGSRSVERADRDDARFARPIPIPLPEVGAPREPAITHIVAERVTKPLPVFTHATVHNGVAYVSCVQGFRPGTFEFPSPEAGDQARQVLENLQTILEQAGSSLRDVLKVTIFLRDMSDFPEVNEAFNRAFPERPPARSTIAVTSIPRDARVAIEAVAAVRA